MTSASPIRSTAVPRDRERFPATFELALAAAIFAICSAFRWASTQASTAIAVSKLFLSSRLSHFAAALSDRILLIYVFAVHLGVLPSFGRGEVVALGGWTTGLLTRRGSKR